MWLLCTLPSDVRLRQNLHVLINTQCFGPESEAQGHVGNGMFPRGYVSSRSEHHIEWCFRALSTDLHGIWSSREDGFCISYTSRHSFAKDPACAAASTISFRSLFGANRILHILLSSVAAS